MRTHARAHDHNLPKRGQYLTVALCSSLCELSYLGHVLRSISYASPKHFRLFLPLSAHGITAVCYCCCSLFAPFPLTQRSTPAWHHGSPSVLKKNFKW